MKRIQISLQLLKDFVIRGTLCNDPAIIQIHRETVNSAKHYADGFYVGHLKLSDAQRLEVYSMDELETFMQQNGKYYRLKRGFDKTAPYFMANLKTGRIDPVKELGAIFNNKTYELIIEHCKDLAMGTKEEKERFYNFVLALDYDGRFNDQKQTETKEQTPEPKKETLKPKTETPETKKQQQPTQKKPEPQRAKTVARKREEQQAAAVDDPKEYKQELLFNISDELKKSFDFWQAADFLADPYVCPATVWNDQERSNVYPIDRLDEARKNLLTYAGRIDREQVSPLDSFVTVDYLNATIKGLLLCEVKELINPDFTEEYIRALDLTDVQYLPPTTPEPIKQTALYLSAFEDLGEYLAENYDERDFIDVYNKDNAPEDRIYRIEELNKVLRQFKGPNTEINVNKYNDEYIKVDSENDVIEGFSYLDEYELLDYAADKFTETGKAEGFQEIQAILNTGRAFAA